MNRYMTELSQMIPACSAVPRKLDKLSILRMAVEYMKRLRGMELHPWCVTVRNRCMIHVHVYYCLCYCIAMFVYIHVYRY